MKDLLDKITFRLLIGQILPGAFLALTVRIALESAVTKPASFASHVGPKEIVAIYDAGLHAANNAYGLVVLATFSAVLGLVLQTTGNLTTANLDSFRGKMLDANNCWVEKNPKERRHRSWMRKRIASLWYEKKIWLILLVGPWLMLFDFITTIAAKPRDLYKEIYLLRIATENMSKVEAVISDYEYSADYFNNMSMALSAHLILCLHLFNLNDGGPDKFLYLFTVYLLVSLHYVSYRIVRNSIDKAIYVSFSKVNKEDSKDK